MRDTFTAYAPLPEPVLDADGMETTDYTTVGTTPGKITGGSQQSADTATRKIRVGGVAREVVEGGLHLPVGADTPTAGDLGSGWEYELTELGPTTPDDLLGSRWLVVDAPAKSYMTARRLDVVRLR
jgi:hypothetical protein